MKLGLFARSVGWTKKLSRVVAYLSFVAFVMLAVAARSVWASVQKSALAVGDGLIALGDVGGPEYRVRLNGETMNVSSATTEVPVSEVLDRFESECRAHAGGLEAEFKTLPETLKGKVPDLLRGSVGLGVVRKEKNEHGMVACLAHDDADGSVAFAARLRRFAETGDLSAIGGLRYVTAKKEEDGRTHVVSAWTDGPFRIGTMFSAEGDSPGDDPKGVRPPDSQRLLSASVEGAPFGVRVYDSDASPQAVLAQYDRDLPAQGWEPLVGVAQSVDGGRAYSRAGVDMLIFTGQGDDGRCLVSIVAMPPR